MTDGDDEAMAKTDERSKEDFIDDDDGFLFEIIRLDGGVVSIAV
jgi:hypothetical protein